MLAVRYRSLQALRAFLVTEHDLYSARGLVQRAALPPDAPGAPDGPRGSADSAHAAALAADLLQSYGGGPLLVPVPPAPEALAEAAEAAASAASARSPVVAEAVGAWTIAAVATAAALAAAAISYTATARRRA